jgi:hypothetical protein
MWFLLVFTILVLPFMKTYYLSNLTSLLKVNISDTDMCRHFYVLSP